MSDDTQKQEMKGRQTIPLLWSDNRNTLYVCFVLPSPLFLGSETIPVGKEEKSATTSGQMLISGETKE